MRMNWDEYFIIIAEDVSLKSKCLSRNVGVVIVKDGKFIISTGYNGPAAKCPHCDDPKYRAWLATLKNYPINPDNVCPRQAMGYQSSEGMLYCQAAHAERNSIDISAKLGHKLDGATLYMNSGYPCMECAKSIVNSGIKEVVIISENIYESKGISGKDILLFGGVSVRIVNIEKIKVI